MSKGPVSCECFTAPLSVAAADFSPHHVVAPQKEKGQGKPRWNRARIDEEWREVMYVVAEGSWRTSLASQIKRNQVLLILEPQKDARAAAAFPYWYPRLIRAAPPELGGVQPQGKEASAGARVAELTRVERSS